MGVDVPKHGEHEATEAGAVPGTEEKYAINNSVMPYFVPFLS